VVCPVAVCLAPRRGSKVDMLLSVVDWPLLEQMVPAEFPSVAKKTHLAFGFWVFT